MQAAALASAPAILSSPSGPPRRSAAPVIIFSASARPRRGPRSAVRCEVASSSAPSAAGPLPGRWAQRTVVIPPQRRGCHLITSKIVNDIRNDLAEFKCGMAHLFLQHTSASLTINENYDSDVQDDTETFLNRIVPEGPFAPWRHTIEVILSDYYDLPFSDVLDWRKFAVVLKESDIYQLKSILKSISQEEFVALHKSLVKVQKHFEWHSPPIPYDAFHMVMYELWLRHHVIKY